MTSHIDYIKDQDEEQLAHLIEVSQIRIKGLRESDYVKVWVVGAGGCNHGWFAEDDYATASEFAKTLVGEIVARGRHIDNLYLEKTKVRPSDAEKWIEETKQEFLK